MEALEIVRIAHIAAGFGALALFTLPMLTRKGGRAHRRAGWGYVVSMAIVSVSAILIAGIRLTDAATTQSARHFAVFLIFVAVLSCASAFYGIRVLRQKERAAWHRSVGDVSASFALLLAGLVTAGYGFSVSSPLITWFPLIGVFLGGAQLAYWLRSPKRSKHWWFEHMGGMFACCIATITAFLVAGAPRLLGLSGSSPFLWFAPTAVLVPILIGWQRYYDKRFTKRPTPDPLNKTTTTG